MNAMLAKIEHENILELNLNRPPANALDPALVQALRDALVRAPQDGVRAIVLSGAPGMLSAGLDVPVLLKLDRRAMSEFWRSFLDLLCTLALSPVPVAMAMTGHSPAGGAVLAIFCDTRIAADGKFKIGLNEVRVGLPVPRVIHAALVRLVGARQAERLCVGGLLISPEEALRIGLVDRITPPDEVVPAALAWCREYLSLPAEAAGATRRLVREDLADMFTRLVDRTHEEMTEAWFSRESQAALHALVEQLAARKR